MDTCLPSIVLHVSFLHCLRCVSKNIQVIQHFTCYITAMIKSPPQIFRFSRLTGRPQQFNMRLCMSTGMWNVSILEFVDGKLVGNELTQESHYAYARLISQIGNSTDVSFVTTLANCIELFDRNLTDFSIGNYDYTKEAPSYYVPCPNSASSIYFISGYDVNKFQSSEMTNAFGSKFGVLHNFANFSIEIYAVIFLFLALAVALIAFKVKLCSKKSLMCLLKRPRSLFNKLVCGRRSTRLLSFLFHSGFFLISTPFLLLFKTSQVVTPKEPFITNYEQVLSEKPSIYYSNILFNETSLMMPNKRDIEENTIRNRMWKYFKGHSETFPADAIERYPATGQGITNHQVIFIGPLDVLYPIKQAFCSFSISPELFKMSLFKDENQRETLTGYALRRGMSDKKFIKRIRNVMEFYYHDHLPRLLTSYAGFEWGYGAFNAKHRHKQLSVCQDEESSQKEHVLQASDLRFFDCFLRILATAVFLDLAAFWLHKKLHRHPKVSKKKCTNNSGHVRVARARRILFHYNT